MMIENLLKNKVDVPLGFQAQFARNQARINGLRAEIDQLSCDGRMMILNILKVNNVEIKNDELWTLDFKTWTVNREEKKVVKLVK